MSDEQDKSVEEQVDAEPKGPRGGERLAEARREQQISVLEVAKELHIDEPKVRALERNEFEILGAPVFAKGHLKKYASLVGVDADDVLADYYHMTRQDTIPPVVIGRKRVRQELSPGPWIAAIIIIMVAAASYWWFAVYNSQPVAPQTSPEEAEVEPLDTTPEESALPQPDTAVSEAEPEPEIVVSDTQQQISDEDADAGEDLNDGEVRLSFRFTGDCWTEVTDSSGQRLFFEMGRSGTSIDLVGVPPFAVLFGNVDNVQVLVNGSDYPVSSNNPGSRTARLTIMNP
jgi:cytoskeleton protein RodZ